MTTAIALVAALTALAGAASAQARPLSMTAAERAARAAVAPAVVESVDCERQPGTTGRAALSRAFCTVFHPSDPGAQLATGVQPVRALEVGLHVSGFAAGEGAQRAA